ncbi:MAG: hypothetical protein E6J90_06620, partial [Deltaproteobacteria bacterium]
GGVLVGEVLRDDAGPYLRIDATIDALHADEKGAELTFTHATWEHIHKEMDGKHQDKRVVGWYHTHPGFGVFLSDRDQFIHKSFFNLPFQVAFVYDPKSREHGMFTWHDNEVWRARRYWIGAGGAAGPRSRRGAQAQEGRARGGQPRAGARTARRRQPAGDARHLRRRRHPGAGGRRHARLLARLGICQRDGGRGAARGGQRARGRGQAGASVAAARYRGAAARHVQRRGVAPAARQGDQDPRRGDRGAAGGRRGADQDRARHPGAARADPRRHAARPGRSRGRGPQRQPAVAGADARARRSARGAGRAVRRARRPGRQGR